MAEPGKLSLTATLLLIVGLAFLAIGVVSIAGDRGVRSWPSVDGRIVSAQPTEQIVEHTNAASGRQRTVTRHNAAITYEYTVAGETRRGDRVSRHDPVSRQPLEVEQLLERYPVGRAVPVYYDPDRPGDAVLVAQPQSADYTPILFGSLVALLGVAFKLLARRGMKREP